MYNMGTEKTPSKPVIASLAQVDRQLQLWLKENDLTGIEDSDGLNWRLEISVLEKPANDDLHAAVLSLTFAIKADTSAADFVRTGVLDQNTDTRLIELIGSRLVPLRMKPMNRAAKNPEHARILLAEMTLDMRKKLSTMPIRDVKRRLIGRFVDSLGKFGAAV